VREEHQAARLGGYDQVGRQAHRPGGDLDLGRPDVHAATSSLGMRRRFTDTRARSRYALA
jgi:hypothetical protein